MDQVQKRWKQKEGSSLGPKIDKNVNQDGPDKSCKEEGTLREVKRGWMALSFRWINDGAGRHYHLDG
jgi:hypothetical protein